ncbi:MAG: beta-galactosidase [Armatimonadota bacterium]|nr:MAG: beta-galactosidase [Armatimonadota bacterium]
MLALCLLLAVGTTGLQDGWVTVRPPDTGEALVNPGMGWVLHYYDNIPENYGSRLEPSDTVDDFPGLSVVYLRIPWSYIELEEGHFNWSVLDTPAQRWIAKGKQVALRISCSESWTRWATPEWVHRAGARGYDFEPGVGVKEGGPYWEPDYDDPVFLQKLENFLAALAKRYDGNPEVAFIDVGSLGVWGEGHTFASTRRKISPETVKRHIDLHLKYFKRTLLAANDDFSFHGEETIDYAREKGLTLRDDSILVQGGENAYFHAGMAQAFWRDRPVILECEHYGPSKERGYWQDGSKYLQAVEEYHASYASIHWWPREFLQENRELIEKINRRLGYRLRLVEASWQRQVKVGDRWHLRWRWSNVGVAPCYRGGYPAITWKDEKGGVVAVLVDEGLNVRNLPVAPPDKAEAIESRASFALPFQLKPGVYSVYVSVGTLTGTPELALPLPGNDGQKRYLLGQVEVLH